VYKTIEVDELVAFMRRAARLKRPSAQAAAPALKGRRARPSSQTLPTPVDRVAERAWPEHHVIW
jgi:hypothetical protein